MGESMVNVNTLAGHFTRLTHLPMIAGTGVLQKSIAKGVGRGLSAYALGDGEATQFDSISFREPVAADDCELIESTWLLRPALPEELLPKPVGAETLADTAPPIGPEGPPPEGARLEQLPPPGLRVIVEGERRLNWVSVQMRVPCEHWLDIYSDVIEPLAKEGAEILVDVNITARAGGAVRENTVELNPKESLAQRGIDVRVDTR